MTPITHAIQLPSLLRRLSAALPKTTPVYLVGGAVRDALLSRATHDLDFVLPGNAIEISRRVANSLGASFYPLDETRDTGRVVIIAPNGSRQTMDFAAFRGPDLESDLLSRDFTINAMAIPIREPGILIDPLSGAQDLRQGRLRHCSTESFLDDPIRILRCARMAVTFGLHILPETRRLARQAIPELQRISPERLRDELFRILESPKPATTLRTLDILGAIPNILPELPALKAVEQSHPHRVDAWNHTLSAVQYLTGILNILGPQHDPETTANWTMGMIALRLGRYRQQLHEHLSQPVNPDRSLHSLLLLAALYHDIGKSHSQQIEEDGRIRFIGHDQVGAKIAVQRAAWLRLSNAEIARLVNTVRYHMRPLLLSQNSQPLSRRAIYRFFRDSGEAGIDICLLSLADILATYGPTLPQEIWVSQLDTVRSLMAAWWDCPGESISPPTLLTGRDLIEAFELEPGPRIGQLLEALREAQAAGELDDREQALAFASAWLDEQKA